MNEAAYILLPVHNRRETTLCMAHSLCGQTFKDFQLILIDDGSVDGTADAVCALLPDTVVIHGEGNWWWAGCLHHGCVWLTTRGVPKESVICFLNDDVDIAPDFIEQALGELAAHPDTLLLARQKTPTEVDAALARGGVRADLVRLNFIPELDPAAVNCLPTRGLFLRWGDLRRIGGFYPRLLPHYLSDYEFTLRAHRRGLRLRVAKKAVLSFHPNQTGWSREALFFHPRRRRFAMLFSNRFKDNPLTRSAFVWLAVPLWWRPWVALRVWGSFAILFGRCLIMPVLQSGTPVDG